MKKIFLGALGLTALMLAPVTGALACIACDGNIETVAKHRSIGDSWDPNKQLGYKTVEWKAPDPAYTIDSVTLTFDYSWAGSKYEDWSVFVDTDANRSNGVYGSYAIENSGVLPVTIDAARLQGDSLTFWFQESSYTTGLLGFKHYNDLDSLVLNEVKLSFDCSSTTVPVPAAAPLFLGGLGLVGWVGRRRRSKSA